MFGFSIRAISAILTIGYLLTSINACAVHTDEPQSVSPVLGVSLGTSSSTMNILQCRPEISLSLQQATDSYIKQQDDMLQINVQTVADERDYRATLRAKLLAGEPVDLFHITGATDANTLMPYLEDLSALSWVNSAAGGVAEAVTVEDRIYGVPYSIQATGLIANRNIFEAVGIPLGNIVDFDSLNEAFAELKEQIDSGTLKDQFPNLSAVTEFAGQDAAYLSDIIADVALTGAYSSPLQASLSPSLNLPDGSEAESFISLLARYSPHGGNWPGLVTVAQNGMVENGFATQRVAVILQDAEVYRRIYAINPDLEGRLALLPIPLEGEETSYLYIGSPVYWAVNAASNDQAKTAAEDFLTWLYRSQEGATLLAEEFAVFSPYRDTAQPTNFTVHKPLLAALEEDATQPQIHREFPETWGEKVFAAQLQEFFTIYDKSWAEMITACQEGWVEARAAASDLS